MRPGTGCINNRTILVVKVSNAFYKNIDENKYQNNNYLIIIQNGIISAS